MTRTSIFLICLFFSCIASAQYNDAGLWADVSLSHEVSDRLEITVSPEIRLDENISRWSRCFVDVSAEYSLNKRFSMSAAYRGGLSNDGVHVDPRQRLQYGLTIKEKQGDFVLQYQSRIQLSIAGAVGDADADFVTIWRNRLGIKYTGLKKLDLATSFELFNNTSQYNPLQLQNWRWTAQGTRKITKKHSIAAGYLIQRDLTDSPMETDYVILLSYKVEL